MKLSRKKTYIVLAILVLLLGSLFFSAMVVEVFDIQLSKPERIYYEPDKE